MLAAAATTWATVQVLSVRMEEFDKRLDQIVQRVERINQDFYVPRVSRESGERR